MFYEYPSTERIMLAYVKQNHPNHFVLGQFDWRNGTLMFEVYPTSILLKKRIQKLKNDDNDKGYFAFYPGKVKVSNVTPKG